MLVITLQVFELDHSKAWRAVLVSIVAMSISMYLVHIAPWFLLPAAWALAGTALTGVGGCTQLQFVFRAHPRVLVVVRHSCHPCVVEPGPAVVGTS